MEGRRRPGIKDGDSVIIFESDGRKVRFTSYGTVQGVDVDDSGSLITFTANVRNLNELDPERELSDFAFSLQKVYRYFFEPERHFIRNRYLSLTQADFDTIIKGRLYWARTAFGTYFNRLPETTQDEFIRYIVDEDVRLLIGDINYATLWTFLRTYLEGTFEGAHALLNAIRLTIGTLAGKGMNITFDELQLGEDDSNVTDSINQQYQRLDGFMTSLQSTNTTGVSLFVAIDQMIERNASNELEFEQIFKGTRWPTLTIKI